jgi:cytochrome c
MFMRGVSMAVAVLFLAGVAAAAEHPSVAKGKELFESSKLGSNGKSCATCHSGGAKLELAATYDEERLSEIINSCIRKPLQGKPLAEDSVEMKSMIMYLKTLGRQTK